MEAILYDGRDLAEAARSAGQDAVDPVAIAEIVRQYEACWGKAIKYHEGLPPLPRSTRSIKGNWHRDETIQCKIMAMVFSMATDIERGLISARTKEALRAKRASGLPVGRSKGPGKSKLDKHRPEIEALLANGSPQKFIAKRYNSSPANLANWMKKRGVKKPKL